MYTRPNTDSRIYYKGPAFSCQGAYAGFVYTYAVTPPMSLPHKTAGYLASIFWAAITAGRLLSIPLSYRFQPVRLLMFNLVKPIKHIGPSHYKWDLKVKHLYPLLFVFTGWCYCYCVDAAYFLHQQHLFICWYLLMWLVPQQHLPLYACLYWRHPWLSGYDEVFIA